MERQDYAINSLLLEQIIEEDQTRLGKPIGGRLEDVYDELETPTEPAESLLFKVVEYLFSDNKEEIILAEREIRDCFSKVYSKIGMPQFTTVYQSPECRRDIFLTSNAGKSYIYLGSVNFTE